MSKLLINVLINGGYDKCLIPQDDNELYEDMKFVIDYFRNKYIDKDIKLINLEEENEKLRKEIEQFNFSNRVFRNNSEGVSKILASVIDENKTLECEKKMLEDRLEIEEKLHQIVLEKTINEYENKIEKLKSNVSDKDPLDEEEIMNINNIKEELIIDLNAKIDKLEKENKYIKDLQTFFVIMMKEIKI